MYILGIQIVDDRRIDEEDDGHVHCLARLQYTFGEAETLDLVEKGARRHGRDVKGRLAGGSHIRGVRGGIGDLDSLADPEFDLALNRLEIPRQTGRDVGIEPYLDRAVEDRVRHLLDALRGAAVTGDLAEQLVERHGGVADTDHRGHECRTRDNNAHVGSGLAGIRRSAAHCLFLTSAG